MYFDSDDHKDNYNHLMSIYKKVPGKDPQYEAQIYIAAYPYIFDLLNLNKLDTSAGPLFNLMEWDEQEERHVTVAPGLTGSTTRLVHVGLSLYNGYLIGLDDVFGSMTSQELFDVFVQACKIRANK